MKKQYIQVFKVSKAKPFLQQKNKTHNLSLVTLFKDFDDVRF